jgi:two-component system chemotaxis response regulator CheB
METSENINATCPECRGPLTKLQEEEIVQFRCLVGHLYSPGALLQEHSRTQEGALWAAVVSLEESAVLVEHAGSHFSPAIANQLKQQAILKQQQAKQIRKILEELEPFQTC